MSELTSKDSKVVFDSILTPLDSNWSQAGLIWIELISCERDRIPSYEEDKTVGSVYRIIKEQRKSGMRYIVDDRDDSGRRTMRRFKKACEAEAFKKWP